MSIFTSVLSARRRLLIQSSLARSLRWEFWPMWIFYIPVVFYIVWLALRYRSLAFTAVNPGLPASGFIGENKSRCLMQLQKNCPEYTATTLLVPVTESQSSKLMLCQQFMQTHQLNYPIVLKPDFGQRGVDVAIIDDEEALSHYLRQANVDTVIQEYIAGVEFGVFYMRDPERPSGYIFSLTHKCFPVLIGDGVSTIEALIFNHPRLYYMANFLLKKYSERLGEIPVIDEPVNLITLGSHCRGSLFLEGQQYFSSALEQVIDRASHGIEGFYFGRYDVRAADIEAFKRGDIRILEVNGVTSESTNMYDPSYSLIKAYRILFAQWKMAFEIGKKNIHRGYESLSIGDLIAKAKQMNHGI